MLKEGLVVGSYKLVCRLGQPGQDGEVWKALKTNIRIPYAIKFLHNRTEDGRSRFQNEIQKLVEAQNRFTHLMEIHDAGVLEIEGEKKPYYVMKLIDDPQPLDKYLRENAGDPALVVRMLRQAGIGLWELHESLGLNHTDIKGKNLLVWRGREPRLFISDFGFIRKRGEPIDTWRLWPASSPKPHDWVQPDDVDVWQLGMTLRSILSDAPDDEKGVKRWLGELADEMAPPAKGHRVITAAELCERLDAHFRVSPTGVLRWGPVPTHTVASLVAHAYEFRERPLSAELLVDLLIRERRPRIPGTKEEIIQAIKASLSPPDRELLRSWPASAGGQLSSEELPPGIGEEITKKILFGLPWNDDYVESAREEWKFLKALIRDIPSRQPPAEYEALFEKYARAVVRHKKRVQVTLWDAGIRFLTAGKGTHVYFCSGHEDFAVSRRPQGETDLRATAVESLKRGARFVFVVPAEITDAGASARQFLDHVKTVAPALAGHVTIVPVAVSHGAPTGTDAAPQCLQAGQYFTPGFRFVLFIERETVRATHDEGAFFIGLPHGGGELFALQYSVDDNMAREFLRWLSLVKGL